MSNLSQHWNRSKKRSPYILVDLSGDDPTRGDSRGFVGIANALGKILDYPVVTIDKNTIDALEQDGGEVSVEALESYIHSFGDPHIVFGKFTLGSKISQYCEIKPLQKIQGINEILSAQAKDHPLESILVSHHLTPELLREQGQLFRAAYPDIQGHLIAVMMTEYKQGLADALLLATKDIPKATFFLCGSKRTTPEFYYKMRDELHGKIDAQNLSGTVTVIGYDLNATRHNMRDNEQDFNPYAGLIDQADHIVVPNNSLSMFSEPLAAGKTIHIYAPPGSTMFRSKQGLLYSHGLARRFNATQNGAVLDTRQITPVNITGEVAESIAKSYKRLLNEKRIRTFFDACEHPVKHFRDLVP
ncbi:MAG: mitochondrial fission ELM1 family protein [Rhodospirillales bacterium]|nr:mitochondrial fission ELM1 family protein [Rhodospirillales bacterium]MCB9995061.1 mitochondrial fission ELM1 family protein [Rhodospirillales bacterium]